MILISVYVSKQISVPRFKDAGGWFSALSRRCSKKQKEMFVKLPNKFCMQELLVVWLA